MQSPTTWQLGWKALQVLEPQVSSHRHQRVRCSTMLFFDLQLFAGTQAVGGRPRGTCQLLGRDGICQSFLDMYHACLFGIGGSVVSPDVGDGDADMSDVIASAQTGQRTSDDEALRKVLAEALAMRSSIEQQVSGTPLPNENGARGRTTTGEGEQT